MTGGADDKRPFGRQEVMAAVLDAAEELFSQHGVAAVSIREIAAKARVNHGLIYRHFGPRKTSAKKYRTVWPPESGPTSGRRTISRKPP